MKIREVDVNKVLETLRHLDSIIQMFQNNQITQGELLDNIYNAINIINLCLGNKLDAKNNKTNLEEK